MSRDHLRLLGGLLLVLAPITAQAQKKWDWGKPTVDPLSMVLRCLDERTISEVQTREEIAQRWGLVGNINEISRKIAQMDAAGYTVTGPQGRERVQLSLKVQLVYTRPVEFRTNVSDSGMKLYMRRLESRVVIVGLDPRTEQYFREDTVRQVRQMKVDYEATLDADTQKVRDRLHEHAYPWTERDAAVLRRTDGNVVKHEGFWFCRKKHELSMVAPFRRNF